jgi:hypothetical protein
MWPNREESAVTTIRNGVIGLMLIAMGAGFVLAQGDTFVTYGAGAASCSGWTDHLADKAAHAGDLQWVLGFASAAGVFAGVHLKGDANAIEPYVTKYCQEHPADTITTAAASLVGNLR